MLEMSQSRANRTRSRAKERAQQAAMRTADDAKEELVRMAFDALEERFPEQAKERRRGNRLQLIALGIVLGFVLRSYLGR